MLVISPISGLPGKRLRPAVRSGAFTLMELMVSIAILIVIILSVGMIFGGASRSVSISQATMEMLSNVRAVQQLMERDVTSIDKNAFLVIRSRVEDVSNPRSRHFDQVAFIANGPFPNRTGSNVSANPFAESTVANSAHIWIGQMVMEKNNRPDISYVAPDQSAGLPLNALPTGVYLDPVTNLPMVKETEFVLGRHAFLLLPGPANANQEITPTGQPVLAYPRIDWTFDDPANSGSFPAPLGEGKRASLASSRMCAVALTTSQLLQQVESWRINNLDAIPEVNKYCYRFRALASVYDTDINVNPFVNGYFRTHPIALQGVSSFAVEWSDGKIDAVNGSPTYGQLRWYGFNQGSNLDGSWNSNVEQRNPAQVGNVNTGDHYVALFNHSNKDKWPKALRFTYHIVELNNRLQGGRDFTQVIRLPE